MNPRFEKRKQEHMVLSLRDHVESNISTGLEDISLVHEALPDLNFDEVSLSQQTLGKQLGTPFFVSSMTGGWEESEKWNTKLAKICEKRSWVMGAGSQRGELEDPRKSKEWRNIRQACPDLILLGNIGLAQIISTPLAKIEQLVESLQAQAMQVHLNPLQEALQHEGTPFFKGGLQALKVLIKELSVPVILKETGCGFSKKTLERVNNQGLYAVDVSGLGGTHWGKLEGKRLPDGDFREGIGETFASWGVRTCDSLLYSREEKRDFKLWASGGLRNGLDAAKALALGAELVGFGKPILQALHKSEESLEQLMSKLEYELKVSLFCTGSSCIKDLRDKWKKNF